MTEITVEVLTNKIISALDILEAEYHNEATPPELGHEDAIDGLMLTLLSQNTNDKNRDVAFRKLKELYPAWPEVVKAGEGKIMEVIRTAGLAQTKARRMINILKILHDDFGEYSLRRLAGRDPDEVRSYLRALPGVGAKTAACVMLFDMKMPAFPVDTHVARVTRRLGIAPKNFMPEEISRMLEVLVPPKRYLGGHVNFIAHGRKICQARSPHCEECKLREICSRKF